MKKLHVVLGGSGAVGASIIKELQARGLSVRSVERSKTVEGVENIHADALNLADLQTAVKDASHIYVCIGLPYQSKIWMRDWPKIIANVVSAAEKENAKVIFFDNVYMYGPHPLPVPFDEDTPQKPTTKKGLARKQSADVFMRAIADGKIKGFIARSADFYGPRAVNSTLYVQFLENIAKGKNPQFLGKKGVKHTSTYLLDAANAIVRLAQDDSAYGHVWHMPVSRPVTIDEIMAIINDVMGTGYKVQYVPLLARKLLSLFIPIVKEVEEMLYQFNEPYVMSWEKLHAKYPDIQATPIEDGLRAMIRSMDTVGSKRDA